MGPETTDEYVARKAAEFTEQFRKERLFKLKQQLEVDKARKAFESLVADANRYMGLPEDGEYGAK